MHLLIAAAGSGSRMGAHCNKLLLDVAGRSVLSWTLNSVKASTSIDWIGIVGQPLDKAAILSVVEECALQIHWIDGGSTRQESVQRGLNGLPSDAKYVLIHDAARCLVEPKLLNQCADLVKEGIAVVAATPVTDTIKQVSKDGFITATPDRSELWAAQTPQGFNVAELKNAHEQALKHNWSVTDDAALFEKLGRAVKILESPSSNIKVTTPFDLIIAEALLFKRA
mgnify:CR=1 FL=1